MGGLDGSLAVAKVGGGVGARVGRRDGDVDGYGVGSTLGSKEGSIDGIADGSAVKTCVASNSSNIRTCAPCISIQSTFLLSCCGIPSLIEEGSSISAHDRELHNWI